MKTLISFFAIVMVFFAGCAKDYTSDENFTGVELKKAKVPIPFMADMCAVPDMESEFILFRYLDLILPIRRTIMQAG